jgi:hypothetical protein
MNLKPLTIKEKKLVTTYLAVATHQLSVYAFENIYIWKPLFEIYWAEINDSLCVFFKDPSGYFLYLPPLSAVFDPEAIEASFEIMERLNRNPHITRIENLEEEAAARYQQLGYRCTQKSCDYLCSRAELVQLRGNRFKSKRAVVNYFTSHYLSEYRPFSLRDAKECLALYGDWMKERSASHQEYVYREMLKDSLACLRVVLDEYRHFNMRGRVVKIGRRIKAFTFGFPLSDNSFCVLYEVADLSIKGLSQFIFRQFCSELKPYAYINIMDDSGLENLKKVKLSYHPGKLVPAYSAQRNHV